MEGSPNLQNPARWWPVTGKSPCASLRRDVSHTRPPSRLLPQTPKEMALTSVRTEGAGRELDFPTILARGEKQGETDTLENLVGHEVTKDARTHRGCPSAGRDLAPKEEGG